MAAEMRGALPGGQGARGIFDWSTIDAREANVPPGRLQAQNRIAASDRLTIRPIAPRRARHDVRPPAACVAILPRPPPPASSCAR
jgi:hypothetical protein